jgi:hypothetical protein
MTMSASWKSMLYGISAVVILTGIAGTVAFAARQDHSDPNALDPKVLLLDAGDWQLAQQGFDPLSVETTDHKGLSGEVITTRIWSLGTEGRKFGVKQFVQRQDSELRAHQVFADEEPGPSYRKKLGGAEKLSVALAMHADEAVGYCVPRAPRCSIVSYDMRYGEYLVSFGLSGDDFSTTSGEAMLKTLDGVVASRLAGNGGPSAPSPMVPSPR